MNHIIALLITMLVSANLQPAPIKIPKLLEGETRVSKVTIKHKAKLSRSQQLTLNSAAKRIESRVHWEGQGAGRHLVLSEIAILHGGCKAKITFTFLPGNELKIKHFETILTSPSGKVIGRAFFDLTDPVLQYPPFLVHPATLDLVFRTFEYKTGNRRKFDLWLGPNAILSMETRVGKIEEVALPGGKKMKCYRLEMKPDLAEDFGVFVSKLLSPLLPDYTFWINAKAPHYVVKYRGPMGQVSPMGAPTETHELIKYTPGGGG